MIYWILCQAEPRLLDEEFARHFLSSEELDVLGTLHFAKRRKEWLLGRWAVKQLFIGSIFGQGNLPLASISIHKEPEGAPFIRLRNEGQFPTSISISHRADWAFCALSTDPIHQIGADIEQIESRPAGFLSDYFTTREQEFVLSQPPLERDLWVTAAWSLKESALKALRKGLRIDTRCLEVDFAAIDREPFEDVSGWSAVVIRTTKLGNSSFASSWRKFQNFVLTLAVDVGVSEGTIQTQVHFSPENLKEIKSVVW